jgi:hypothetical protein
MLLPLITAVPRVELAGPPLVAMRAPGSREFLNFCPFRATVDGCAARLECLIVLPGRSEDKLGLV